MRYLFALLCLFGLSAASPPNFSVSDVTVAEGSGQAVVTITKSAKANSYSKVTYKTVSGSALPGQDYAPVSGTLTFGNSQIKQTVSIPIVDNTVSEGVETFTVQIAGTRFASVLKGTGVVTITDNDAPVPPQPVGWTFCAGENQTCYVNGNADVRYGAGTTWNTKNINNSIVCDNATFGDPIWGTPKTCETTGTVVHAPCPDGSPWPVNGICPTPPPAGNFTLGMVLGQSDWWGGGTIYRNLINGSDWTMQNTNPWGGSEDVPDQYRDLSTGWLKSLPPNYRGMRTLSAIMQDADIVCTFHGNGASLMPAGPVSNPVNDGTKLTFHYKATLSTGEMPATLYFNVDPANPVRDIDCHSATSDPAQNFDPLLLDTVKGFKVIRFVKWQPSVESNSGNINGVTFPPPNILWSNRSIPNGGNYLHTDGVPVEVMVDLANQSGADPWFNMPWNADDDFIRRFATYVRDNLRPGRKVYVETSNEVWNAGYWVYHQAAAEGLAENLPHDYGGSFQAMANRYGEKVGQVNKIWADVFAGQSDRLVRLYCWQTVNNGYGEEGLRRALPNVDAFCTAPYFAFMQNEYTGQSLDEIMNTILPAKVAEQIDLAKQSKAIATKYNLRYVSYEGGQHVVLPNNTALLTQIERDPRMKGLYDTYIHRWSTEIGDELTLFAGWGPIGSYGAWGLVEYTGQPVSLAPKMQSAREHLVTP